MPKESRGGRGLKRVLEWVLNRDIIDLEIAEALNKPAATFSRRKDADDFPTYEELDLIGDHFGVNPRWLQVEFGYLDADELRADPSPLAILTKERKASPKSRVKTPKISEMPVRTEAPPLG